VSAVSPMTLAATGGGSLHSESERLVACFLLVGRAMVPDALVSLAVVGEFEVGTGVYELLGLVIYAP